MCLRSAIKGGLSELFLSSTNEVIGRKYYVFKFMAIFIPSFSLRPLPLPWDCIDSLHLQNDASEVLCTTSKQAESLQAKAGSRASRPIRAHSWSRWGQEGGQGSSSRLQFHLFQGEKELDCKNLISPILLGTSPPPLLHTQSPTYFLGLTGSCGKKRTETRNPVQRSPVLSIQHIWSSLL